MHIFKIIFILSQSYYVWSLVSRSNVRMAFENMSQNPKTVLKTQILQLGAALDRGQAYNPTSGPYYKDRMDVANTKVKELISLAPPVPTTLSAIDGEWELVYSSVPHGLFRSSPFFLAIQEAYSQEGVEGAQKAQLFFKLHELQTMSWGASKLGRIAQYIDSTNMTLTSEFDTSLLSLTVIPIIGWFKLLPTFGGCVITVSKVKLNGSKLDMEVEYTTSKKVDGLPGIGESIFGKKVPVNPIWKLLPWNKGRAPTCWVDLKYVDEDFRIVEDRDGELFVYTRPVCPRP